jgi:hypothetical protein
MEATMTTGIDCRLQALKAAYRLDWIRNDDPPRWMTADRPDHRQLGRDFYSPVVRWSVGGKSCAYAVPVQTKVHHSEIRMLGIVLWSHDWAEYDDPAMWADLAETVKDSAAPR